MNAQKAIHKLAAYNKQPELLGEAGSFNHYIYLTRGPALRSKALFPSQK